MDLRMNYFALLNVEEEVSAISGADFIILTLFVEKSDCGLPVGGRVHRIEWNNIILFIASFL